MPATSSSKKPDSNQNKKADITPVRISSRVRKEKFSVKELFNSRDRDVSSDDEAPSKKKLAMTPTTSKGSNVQVVKASTSRIVRSDSAKITKTVVTKSIDNKSKILSVTPRTLSNLGKAEIKTGILRKSDIQTAPKASLLRKPDISTSKAKQDDNLDELSNDNIKIDAIFNQDNIEAVLENPSAVGLDVIVTKLSESDQSKQHESKKLKNVVTIAKVQGSQPASKPFKVVPMKPSPPESKSDPKTSPSSILKTPLNSSLIIEKKKVNQTSLGKPGQVKEVKVNRSLGSDVLDRNIRMLEKKRQVRPLDTKYDKSLSMMNNRSLLISDNLRHVQEESEKRLKELRGEFEDEKINPYDFERYFTISESYIEHNESLDEDSNDEDNYLSHFFEKESSMKRRRYSEGEELTIPELMHQVNSEFPSWNLHSLSDNSFLICQVTRDSQGLPLMSKTIELNSDLNLAKIYVNQILQKETNGSYNSYESVRELISSVQDI